MRSICVCVCHRDPPMEAALLASFTTSPSCSSSQSATYCPPPLLSTSHIPIPLLVSFLFQPHPFLSPHTVSILSLLLSGFPSPFHLLVFLLSLLFDSLVIFALTLLLHLLPPSHCSSGFYHGLHICCYSFINSPLLITVISISHNLFLLSSACHCSCQSFSLSLLHQ